MIHAVKCLPPFFVPLSGGSKTFEVRKNDRPYRVGDYLAVNEFVPDSEDPYDEFEKTPLSDDERQADNGRYSGNCVLFKITYILDDKNFCKEGYVILGLKRIEEVTYDTGTG
ncbi:MAG: DUF3850 domain-containing protein [Oscillospiraceae bacterium]|nr:DUF3850 domain-containing protein [Oscillospiraceae bacterium]